MSDFVERARAEAERRWETYSDAAGGADVFDKPSLVVGFLGGARWASDVLLADPTDAEVTSVAEALVAERYRMHGVDLEKAKSSGAMWQLDIEFLRPQARAALAAFLAERRGSE